MRTFLIVLCAVALAATHAHAWVPSREAMEQDARDAGAEATVDTPSEGYEIKREGDEDRYPDYSRDENDPAYQERLKKIEDALD